MVALFVGAATGPAAGPVGAQSPAAGDPTVDYSAPVDAPVIDPFRPPPQPWLPGNRGIEYETVPGTPVRAAADGVVTFAGSVAGSLHVTVRHADGIRTSYSFLATVGARTGQRLARGDVVGVAGSRLHVGARRGDTYIDPESLWGGGPPWVRLAPTGGIGPAIVATGAELRGAGRRRWRVASPW